MENKTPAVLQSDHSIRILGGFRNTLWLQFSQMNRAWRNHRPSNSDTDIQTLAKLGTIVESMRIAVAHVLKISGNAISNQLLWRSNAPSDPNPYTSLSQFHRTVKPSAHPDSPLARKLPYPGSAGSRASHMSPTPSNGRPHYVTSKVTSGERKTTVHSAARTRPKSTSVPKRECKTTVHSAACTRPKSKSVPTEATEQSQPKATPSLI